MSNTTQKSYDEQLSNFASELRDHIDDEAMLHEIHVAIKSMMSGNDSSEREIRDILQQHHDTGNLREESFQLVQKLIDSIVSEELPTETGLPADDDDDPFGSTTVIPTVVLSPVEADKQLQVGSVLRDRFLLAEEIPGGSMGTVYKALDRRLAEANEEEHWVAIKVLSPKLSYDADALRALQQEAVKTRCLSHPNIVRFVDLDRDDELYFMVMEWLDGQSLAQMLDDKANNHIGLDRALEIVTQIGHALDYAHLRGVIHADVKPGNIMITPSGQAKLFDFGIARIRQKQGVHRADDDPAFLKAATPAYSSMQVLTGEEPVAADDVFSLACLAYRLIAGYRVFGPRNAAEAAEAGMEPQRLENLNKEQWQVLKKALSYSRVARFSSPAKFVKALTASNGAVSKSVETIAASDDTDLELFDSRRKRPWRYVALALIFLAAGAVVYEQDLIQLIRPYFNEAADPPPSEVTATTVETPGDLEGSEPAEPVSQQPVGGLQQQAETPVPEEVVNVEEPVADGSNEPIVRTPTPPDIVEKNETRTVQARAPAARAATESTDKPPIDFSALPPANIILPLAGPGESPATSNITLVEDGNGAIIDFVRAAHLEETLALKIVEHSDSGTQSPLATGEYEISNGGLLEFPPGQHRARVEIRMRSDSAREADQRVNLVVLDTDYGDIVLAGIGLTLQDDDQRAFEQRLPPNTIGFTQERLTVRERDAAIQVDVFRFKADNTAQVVRYAVRDVTTTEDDDYIAPATGVLSIGPGERSVRILIPLIQDATREPDETLIIELLGESTFTEDNIYRQIAVMIRDDDT